MPSQTNTSTTATADRIKALASILSDDENDDDDDWGENFISRDNVRDRRNFFQKGHISPPTTTTTTSINTTNGSNCKHATTVTAMTGHESEEIMVTQPKSKSSIGEKSSQTGMGVSHPTASLPIERASTNAQDIILSTRDSSVVTVQRQWKHPALSTKSEENEQGDVVKQSTTLSSETKTTTSSSSSPPLSSPSPPAESLTTTQLIPTSTASDVTPASTSSSSSQRIIFGRPDTFGAAGMGIPTTDNDSYYMPNVKERAKALSYWKLTKKEKNGHQRALEWKRSCCYDSGGGGGDGGDGIMNIQDGSCDNVSYSSCSSGGVGQVHVDSRDQEDIDGLGSGGSSDSASLAAALTVKKASAPCFLAKFVQLLEDDANDNGGGDNHQIENAKKNQNSEPTKKAVDSSHSIRTWVVELDHENTVNGGVPLTPRGISAPSPRKKSMVSSPCAALSPRSCFVSKPSKKSSARTFGAVSFSANLQTHKNTMISKNEKSKAHCRYIPPNIMVTENICHKEVPQSPQTIGKTYNDMSGENYELCSHSEPASDHIDWEEKREEDEEEVEEEKVNQWYGAHRDDDVDNEDQDRMREDDEIEVSVRLATDNHAGACEIPREMKLNDSNGEEITGDGFLVASMTMNSTDSIIEEAMNFLKTPLFDITYPTERRPEHSDDDEGGPCNRPQREQFITNNYESNESELLEVAERFAMSLDRYLIGVDDAVVNENMHVKATKSRAHTQSLEERVTDKLSTSDELQIDPYEWVGWVETPRNVDDCIHSFTIPLKFSSDESGRSLTRMKTSESVLDFGEDGFGEIQLSASSHSEQGGDFFPSIDQPKIYYMTRKSKDFNSVVALNTCGSDTARKPSKLKICIDGAPDFISVNRTEEKETTFFVASQPSPSCGDDTCLLVGQSSFELPASTATTGQGSLAGKQRERNVNIKRILNNKSTVAPSFLFGPLLGDDGSASKDSIQFDSGAIMSCEQEKKITEKSFFVFTSASAKSFSEDTSPQIGFIADFRSNALCHGGSISSSSEITDCAAPTLAIRAKQMLKRITPFSGKSRKMHAFGSLDES